LGPAQRQRRVAMAAVLVEQSDVTCGIAEGDEVLAEQSHPPRVAIRVWQFLGQERRYPAAPERRSHRRPGTDTAHGFVFFLWQHSHFLLPAAFEFIFHGRRLSIAGDHHTASVGGRVDKRPTCRRAVSSRRVGTAWSRTLFKKHTPPVTYVDA